MVSSSRWSKNCPQRLPPFSVPDPLPSLTFILKTLPKTDHLAQQLLLYCPCLEALPRPLHRRAQAMARSSRVARSVTLTSSRCPWRTAEKTTLTSRTTLWAWQAVNDGALSTPTSETARPSTFRSRRAPSSTSPPPTESRADQPQTVVVVLVPICKATSLISGTLSWVSFPVSLAISSSS